MNAPLALAAVLFALPAAAGELKFFDAEGIETLEVRAQKGPLELEAGAPEIRVEVVGNEAPSECLVEITRKGSRLIIEAKNPRRRFWEKETCEAGFRVEGPSRLALKAGTGVGSVKASGWSGPAEIESGVGTVELADMGSTVQVQVGVGDARLRWAKAPARGSVEVSVGVGNAEVRLPQSSAVDAALQTGWGLTVREGTQDPKAGLKLALNSGVGDVAVRTR